MHLILYRQKAIHSWTSVCCCLFVIIHDVSKERIYVLIFYTLTVIKRLGVDLLIITVCIKISWTKIVCWEKKLVDGVVVCRHIFYPPLFATLFYVKKMYNWYCTGYCLRPQGIPEMHCNFKLSVALKRWSHRRNKFWGIFF